MLKKIFHGLFGSLFSVSIFLCITVLTVVTLIRPERIKNWINVSGAYQTLPSKFVEEAVKKQGESNSSPDFRSPIVQNAAKSAITPQFLQSSIEQIIDGNFRWIDGTVAKPDFAVNVLPAKEKFAEQLAAGAKERYKGLPECAKGKFPSSTDPFLIDCRPTFGVDIDTLANAYKIQILNSKDFLPDSVITADTLHSSKDSSSPSFYEQNSTAPKTYRTITRLPILLGLLLLLAGIGMVLTSKTKRAGIRQISNRFMAVGLITFIAIWISSLGLEKLRDSLTKQNNVDSAAYAFKDMILATVNAVQFDIVKISGIIAGAFIATGVVLAIGLKVFHQKPPKAEKSDNSDAKKAFAEKMRMAQTAKPDDPTTPAAAAPDNPKKDPPKPTAPLIQ